MPLRHIKPELYDRLLTEKVDHWQAILSALGAPAAEVFPSPATGYRLRAEFRIWHDGDDLNYVMFSPDRPKDPVVVPSFSIASPVIQAAMEPLRLKLQSQDVLRKKLFQVEFLNTLAGELLVSLIYHRPLDDAWGDAAKQLAADINASIIGRSRKQKRVIGRDWVRETLCVNNRSFHYTQPEGAFTQPNGWVNQHMLEWVTSQTHDQNADLLELYCGVGNFTLPLSHFYRRVLATELSKSATRAATENLALNDITNVEFARLSAEEVAQAIRGDREFRRLKHLKNPLGDYRFTTLFVDPPRAGLDPDTLALASRFPLLIYISCNPTTLSRDIEMLNQTHAVSHLAFFDQFPYTHHLEVGTVLRRKSP
jgi:tRNA (uracil-5-)-methyltransferase